MEEKNNKNVNNQENTAERLLTVSEEKEKMIADVRLKILSMERGQENLKRRVQEVVQSGSIIEEKCS